MVAYIHGAVKIDNSIIKNNQASTYGGGIVIYDSLSFLRIYDSTIINNEAVSYGGGVYSEFSEVYLYNNSIVDNEVTNTNQPCIGGGVYVYESILRLEDSKISGNQARSGGGVAISRSLNVTLEKDVVNNNRANTQGGGIYNYVGSYGTTPLSKVKITRCTIQNNEVLEMQLVMVGVGYILVTILN